MLITPPDQPDNRGSYYSCQACGVMAQKMVRVDDENGEPILAPNGDGELVEQWNNDEPASSAELTEHIETEHPAEATP